MKPLWGIDLGGTKIEGVVIADAGKPDVLSRIRVPTEKHLGYAHVVNQFKVLIDLMSEASGLRPDRVGIGTPGTIEPATGLLKNSNTTVLNGQPLRRDIEAVLGVPVKMANDANCFAVAETLMGAVKSAAPESEVVFGIIMGTGVGGGIVVNGQVLNGKHGIAGEWGHNFLDLDGGPCYCGKVGCVETIISGPALERYYTRLTGTHLPLKDIYANYQKGKDIHANATMNRLVTFFGKAVANVINILDPDCIVLGGGVGNIDLLYEAGVQEVAKHIFNPKVDTRFLKPQLGDSAGVFGAALL
jgi:predicted NBD/HSP70 family sugar kinase